MPLSHKLSTTCTSILQNYPIRILVLLEPPKRAN